MAHADVQSTVDVGAGSDSVAGKPPGVAWPLASPTSGTPVTGLDLEPPVWQTGERVVSDEVNELRRQLHEAKGQVEELQPLAELGELVAFVAHELRNPLAGIAATAEVLRDACEPTDEAADGLAVILGEAERLERVVRNLLDLARFRRLRVLPTDIADDVGRVVGAIAPEAERAGVAVHAERPDEATAVLADSELVQHAFLNLATNAIEATPSGGTLTIRVREPDADSAFVCVEFADTGCGISREDLPKVFDPFFTTRSGGVGLGLAAARKLLEHQGAHITVASEPGAGSCFTVYLRRAGGSAHGWQAAGVREPGEQPCRPMGRS